MTDLLTNRRLVKEDIDLQPWSHLKHVSNEEYLYKILFKEDQVCYKILLHDGYEMWKEEIDRTIFLEKCKLYNRSIEGKPDDLMKHVQKSYEEAINNSTLSITKPTDRQLLLSTKTKLKEIIPFHWTFELTKCSKEEVDTHILNPTFILTVELLRRQKQLYEIIERKDREIQDYKDQGHLISRKHLQTMRFNKRNFESKENVDKDFLVSCRETKPYTLMASPEVVDLYRNIMMNRQQQINIDAAEGPSSATFETVPVKDPPAATKPIESWDGDGRLPPSVVEDDVKHPIEEKMINSPVKDVEQERREALRKRLEEETERKNKKKKRKLKI